MNLTRLVDQLWVTHPAKIRDAVRHLPTVPFGDGDYKTGAPGTYRPVDITCPDTCPYLEHGCYAESGNVSIHQRRARPDAEAAAVSAAAAMVWAIHTGRIARLHVSGDFGKTVDHDYVNMLRTISRRVRKLSGLKVVAWTYTHLPEDEWVGDLIADGIHVRLSDRAGHNGAIVVRDRAEARKVPGRVAVCRAQLQPITCMSCRLCWERPDLTIAFLAHGPSRKRIATYTSPEENP